VLCIFASRVFAWGGFEVRRGGVARCMVVCLSDSNCLFFSVKNRQESSTLVGGRELGVSRSFGWRWGGGSRRTRKRG